MSDDGELVRLHQEDFCQSLGIAPDMKYENEGGPSLQTCFQLVRDHSVSPIADVNALLQWVISIILLVMLILTAKTCLFYLASADLNWHHYDLLCTTIYPGLSSKLAMKIGGEYRPDWMAERHWQQLAKDMV